MKTCYIAGPYTANTTYEVRNNIRKAEKINEWCWSHGIAAICPHCNTSMLDGLCDYRVWAEGYIELLKRCNFDFIILSNGWEKSKGTLHEIEIAQELGISIYKYGDAFGSLYTMDNKYVDLKELLAS